MLKVATIVILVASLGACAAPQTIDQERKEISSAHTGCPANDLAITSTGSASWDASCRGKVFYCTVSPSASCAAKM